MVDKIALVGLGSIGKKHITNLKYLFPNCEIYVCSPSGREYQVNENYQIKKNIDELIALRPDAAIIASPAPYHLQQAAQFQKMNIPILVEKPIASSLGEFISNSVKDENIAVAYCLRYLPATQFLKDFLTKKKLGKIYNIDASVGQFLPDWRKDKNYKDSVSASKKLGGGVLLELSHELDLLNYLIGDLTFQHGYLRTNQELNLEVEEIADIIFLAKKNIFCHLHLDFIQKSPSRTIMIIAQHGRLEWDVLYNKITLKNADGQQVIFDTPDFDNNNMYLEMLKDFVNLVTDKKHQCITIKEAKKVLLLIDEIKHRACWRQ